MNAAVAATKTQRLTMHFCIDIDDTITYFPRFFVALSKKLPDAKITIVTFRTDREASEKYLAEIGMRYDDLILSSDDSQGKMDGQTLAAWKAGFVNSLKPDVFFEDMPEVVKLIDSKIVVFMPCDDIIREWIGKHS